MIDTGLAHTSDLLIYSAMVTYTIAFIAFAIDLSGRRADLTPVAVRPRVAVSAGAGPEVSDVARYPEVSDSDDSSGHSADDAAPTRSPSRNGLSAGSAKALGIAMSLSYLAFALHLAGVVARGLAVHRAPWGNMYEFSITGTLVVTAVFLAVLLREDLRFLGTFVIGPVLLSLGLAVTVLYTRAGDVMPALQSFWLIIHVSVAFIASALFTLGFSLTLLQLTQARREQHATAGRPPVGGRFMNGLPASKQLEVLSYRVHAVAFPLWSFTLIAGAIWAEQAWSRYWNWDPKEVWSFVIWVVYAAYLHARATNGVSSSRAAYIALAGYACLLFNYLVVNFFFVGMHAYAGVKS